VNLDEELPGHGTSGPVPLERLSREAFCYLTTTGRISGEPHTIEIWFALEGSTVFMLSGGGRRSDWVRNLIALPDVKVRIGDRELSGRARIVTDEDESEAARELVVAKYQPRYAGDLGSWRASALPVAIDLRDA
jgi:deazaflavin-dependent oxidoreductase (nitroreductase family)